VNDLEDRLKQHLHDVAELAEPRPDVRTVLEAAPSQRSGDRTIARPWVTAAAVALVVAGVVGLVAMVQGRSRPDDALSNPPPTTIAAVRQFAHVDRLESSDWVTAAAPPVGTEFLLARRDDEIRIVAYGPAGGDDPELRLIIEVNRPPSQASGRTITVAGTVWSVNVAESDGWNVSRQLGDSYVQVRGIGEIDEAVLESLLVVDDAGLPLDPLGVQADARIVARTQLDDHQYTYAVQESGRYRCGWLTTTADGGGHACGPIPVNAVLVIEGTQSLDTDRLDHSVAVAWGSATQDVAKVEVEFIDGSIAAVEPTELDATFGKRYWIVALDTAIPVTAQAVAVVRAYNANGALVATEEPTIAG
jgi:hypothetical protein